MGMLFDNIDHRAIAFKESMKCTGRFVPYKKVTAVISRDNELVVCNEIHCDARIDGLHRTKHKIIRFTIFYSIHVSCPDESSAGKNDGDFGIELVVILHSVIFI